MMMMRVASTGWSLPAMQCSSGARRHALQALSNRSCQSHEDSNEGQKVHGVPMVYAARKEAKNGDSVGLRRVHKPCEVVRQCVVRRNGVYAGLSPVHDVERILAVPRQVRGVPVTR